MKKINEWKITINNNHQWDQLNMNMHRKLDDDGDHHHHQSCTGGPLI